MPKFIDLTGKRFGKLTVLGETPKTKKYIIWLCLCDCGKETSVSVANLANGHTRSCGCLQSEITKKRNVTHNMRHTRIYYIWTTMKARCSNSRSSNRSIYFDKGIRFCDKWGTFEGFYEDMKDGYADNLSIDRIDNDKGYSKDNCRWATATEQANNTSANRIVEVDGNSDTLANTCRAYGVNYHTVRQRLRYGWSIEDAVKKPIRPLKKKEAL
jgi:hypothetical protein